MTYATTDRGDRWDADDLLRLELSRARHALAYLKGKIGRDDAGAAGERSAADDGAGSRINFEPSRTACECD